jgi:hypothetical protein
MWRDKTPDRPEREKGPMAVDASMLVLMVDDHKTMIPITP